MPVQTPIARKPAARQPRRVDFLQRTAAPEPFPKAALPARSSAARPNGAVKPLGVSEELSRRIGQHKFGMWFGHTHFRLEGQRLQVQTDSQFVADWIGSHFVDELREVATELFSPDVQIDICVAAERTPGPVITERPPVNGERQTSNGRPNPKPANRKFRTDLRRLDDFVVGTSNRMAVAEARRIIQEPSGRRIAPLFIHGQCGLGKTHLLQGICHGYIESTGRVSHVRYVTGEQFTNEYITAIRTNALDAFRNKHRKLDLLAIDDVHFLSNKVRTQTEFLYTLDAIDLSGARVVMASDNHPHQIKRFNQALVSRFLSGMVVEIGVPDRAMRLELVQRLASARGLHINAAAMDLIAEKCLGSVRELEGAITKLAAYRSVMGSNGHAGFNGHTATEKAQEIGLVLAEQLFREQAWQPNQTVRLPHLVDVICARLGVARGDVLGSGRHRRIVLARGLIAYLGRELTTHSFPEIAQALGRKNHSTIHTAHHRLREQVAANELLEMGGGEPALLVKDLIDQLRRAVAERRT